ncbi:MAG TPA: acyl-CoA dehydrogenase family protein [Aeromicrobium sp.]|nr:acyl-CoA dehydrogenase family protein [Aeromicrobium sp.]
MTGLAEFRRDIAEWFALNAPADWRETVDRLRGQEYLDYQRQWLRTLGERGFAAPGIPREWGGGGYTVSEQVVIFEEWSRSGAMPLPLYYSVSLNHVPHTILAHGTQEQKERYVRDAIRGTVWCQGFSEPGSGSDLASLRTTAKRQDDHWVIEGQKIWSSGAMFADHCILLARTGSQESRHRGITYFLLDMRAEGVDVRPIRQNTGHHEFCEIFLDSVKLPLDSVLGEVDQGWSVAQTTLETERGPIGMSVIGEIGAGLEMVKKHLATTSPSSVAPERAELATLVARHQAVSALSADIVDLLNRGAPDGGLSSLMKISFSELLRDLTEFASRLNGPSELIDPQRPHLTGSVTGDWTLDWLQSWSWTIAGGTNEIQRNIIAERTLGLPREPRGAKRGA